MIVAAPPVDRRAASVNVEYLAHAHKLDKRWNGTADGDRSGPMERYVKTLGDVVGLAFGTIGEGSRDVHKLAHDCAAAIGHNAFRSGAMRVASAEDAVAAVKRRVYREWGLAAVVGRAHCLLSVLDAVVSRKLDPPSDPDADELAEFALQATLDPSPLYPSFDPPSRSVDVFPNAPLISNPGG